jgi:hypothetical protein
MIEGMEILEPLYGQDGYATPAFFGIIYGPDLFTKTEDSYRNLTGEELKELILLRLKMAYEDAVKKVEGSYK